MTVLCMFVFPLCSADFIPYDTSYQYGLNSKSFSEMLELIPKDYSPPLYAILLKLFTMPFGGTLLSMRAFSLVIFVGVFYIALFPVRRAFGSAVSLVFAVLSLISATNVFFITEARPSVLAYFLVTGGAIYTYLSYRDDKKRDYIVMTVFVILGMYTHNIAMLSVLGFYIVAGCFTLFTKQYAKLKKFLISGIIAAVVYIPWLVVVIGQFSNVLNNFWTGADLGFTWISNALFGNTFDDFGSNFLRPFIMGVIGLCVVVACIRLLIKLRKEKDANVQRDMVRERIAALKDVFFILLMLITAVAMIIIFSLVAYPLLAARYFYILTGVALLIMAIVLVRGRQLFLSCLMVVLVGMNTCFAYTTYRASVEHGDLGEIVDDLNALGDDVCFVHTAEVTLGIMTYYFPDVKHYVHDDMFTVLTTFDVFDSEIIDIGDISKLSEYTESVYFIDSSWLVNDEEYNTRWLLEDLGCYEFEDIAEYSDPYSYISNWRIAKATFVADDTKLTNE